MVISVFLPRAKLCQRNYRLVSGSCQTIPLRDFNKHSYWIRFVQFSSTGSSGFPIPGVSVGVRTEPESDRKGTDLPEM